MICGCRYASCAQQLLVGFTVGACDVDAMLAELVRRGLLVDFAHTFLSLTPDRS
jgi:hypothetical protein